MKLYHDTESNTIVSENYLFWQWNATPAETPADLPAEDAARFAAYIRGCMVGHGGSLVNVDTSKRAARRLAQTVLFVCYPWKYATKTAVSDFCDIIYAAGADADALIFDLWRAIMSGGKDARYRNTAAAVEFFVRARRALENPEI